MLKTYRFWLIVSVCFNLLFLGVFFGGIARHKGRPPLDAPQNEITALMRAMPDHVRKDALGSLSAKRQHSPVSKNDLPALAELIDAEPFDAKALDEFMRQNREANDARILAVQEVVVENITQLTDQERDAMAKKLREMPKRFGGDREHRHFKPRN